MTAQIVDIVKCYAPSSHGIEEAKKEIVRLQKKISEEKKTIKANLKKYKPQIQIYEEMKKVEARAYLYDLAGVKEYEGEYLIYKQLSDRLLKNYGKTIDEIASFCDSQNNQLSYASAQKEELSLQYKALLGYEKYQGRSMEEGLLLFDAVGHSKAKRETEYGVFTSRLVYVAAENTNVILQVMTSPDVVDGKNTVSTTVSVLSAQGEVVEEVSSADLSPREFNAAINELKYKYEFMKCHIVDAPIETKPAEIEIPAKEQTQNTFRRRAR